MFKSPSDAQEYEKKVRQSADSLLSAFEGGSYNDAIAVLDWLKAAVAENSCVISSASSVSAVSPSFPFSVIRLRE
ncbi:hypothetical protein [Pantoea agglomerans]|uniref:Uncharacterized protein n=1 Tax=Enterobacter agglomerans TaxID=549 RepID=A0ACC5RRH5_ENTAG|nr:hypothetical protein [Pantoea agglomerans]MBK4727207.1 hypothetical protein [Pantoea agglomerans]